MLIRLLVILTLLTSCSLSENDITKTIDVSSDRLLEIKSKPYIGGNGPGGFSTAALSNPGDGSSPSEIRFTGFGPYLFGMGFKHNMVLTEIDGIAVDEIFTDRWSTLRLQDPSAFDAAHYKDLIEYLFTRETVDQLTLTIVSKVSPTSISEGQYQASKEIWRLNLQR